MNDSIQVGWNTNFTMIPNELWDLEFLEQEHIVVFVYLARLGAAENGAFPSYPDLAQKCKIRNKNKDICKIRARRIIEKLISFGLLKKGNRKNKRTGVFTSNIYFLTHPKILLSPTKSKDSEEYEITFDTPCVKSNSQDRPNTNDFKEPKSDTGCVKVQPTESIEIEENATSENVTYKDLSIKTNLLKSSSVETEEKKSDFKFLETYSLNSKTSSVILKNFKDLSEEEFKKIYTRLKVDPRVRSIDAAIILSLNGEWEEFEIPDKNKKTPKSTRGDSITIKKIEDNFKIDQEHIQEIEAETSKLLEVYNSLHEELQGEILAEAKSLYLKEAGCKSFDSLNSQIFNSTKNAFITRILKERKFE